MAARRYEISLRVLKNISRVSAANEWNIFSTRYFYYINTSEIPNHFTLIVFWCERRDLLCSYSNGDIFTCEDNMLFSHVKIPNFRAKAHLVFHWCFCNLSNRSGTASIAAYSGLKEGFFNAIEDGKLGHGTYNASVSSRGAENLDRSVTKWLVWLVHVANNLRTEWLLFSGHLLAVELEIES